MAYSVRHNQRTYYGADGSRYLEQEVVSRYKAMEEQLRRAANDAADAAAKSLRRNLVSHEQSGELISSIKVNKATGGTSRRQTAAASVGEGVEHSGWFFEGTGIYGPTGGVIYPVTAKKMGPIAPNTYRSGSGPRFLSSSKGQKPNEKIIEKAQEAARVKIDSRVARLD